MDQGLIDSFKVLVAIHFIHLNLMAVQMDQKEEHIDQLGEHMDLLRQKDHKLKFMELHMDLHHFATLENLDLDSKEVSPRSTEDHLQSSFDCPFIL